MIFRYYWIQISSIFLVCLFYRCAANESQGHVLYQKKCMSCHMADGQGLGGLIPPISDSDYLRSNFELLPCIISHGIRDTLLVNGRTYTDPMAGHPNLKKEEIINIVNYINSTWSYNRDYLSPKAYDEQLRLCKTQ